MQDVLLNFALLIAAPTFSWRHQRDSVPRMLSARKAASTPTLGVNRLRLLTAAPKLVGLAEQPLNHVGGQDRAALRDNPTSQIVTRANSFPILILSVHIVGAHWHMSCL
jgi:hypothetical protein